MSSRKPGEPLAPNAASLVAEADAKVETLALADAVGLLDDPGRPFRRHPRPAQRAAQLSSRGAVGAAGCWSSGSTPSRRITNLTRRRAPTGALLRFGLALGAGDRNADRDGSRDVTHLAGGFSAGGRPVTRSGSRAARQPTSPPPRRLGFRGPLGPPQQGAGNARARVRSVWLAVSGSPPFWWGVPRRASRPLRPRHPRRRMPGRRVPARLVRLTGTRHPVSKRAARGRRTRHTMLVGGQRIPVALTLIRGVPAGAVLAQLSAPVGGDDAAIGALARGASRWSPIADRPGATPRDPDLGEHVLVVPGLLGSSTTDAGSWPAASGRWRTTANATHERQDLPGDCDDHGAAKITLTTTQGTSATTRDQVRVRTITGTTPRDRLTSSR